jgi:hypothetical protein
MNCCVLVAKVEGLLLVQHGDVRMVEVCDYKYGTLGKRMWT